MQEITFRPGDEGALNNQRRRILNYVKETFTANPQTTEPGDRIISDLAVCNWITRHHRHVELSLLVAFVLLYYAPSTTTSIGNVVNESGKCTAYKGTGVGIEFQSAGVTALIKDFFSLGNYDKMKNAAVQWNSSEIPSNLLPLTHMVKFSTR